MMLASEIDTRIEPYPISKQDLISNNPFATEIYKTGIEIKVRWDSKQVDLHQPHKLFPVFRWRHASIFSELLVEMAHVVEPTIQADIHDPNVGIHQ